MMPEAGRFLEKAPKYLDRASTMLAVGLIEDAGILLILLGSGQTHTKLYIAIDHHLDDVIANILSSETLLRIDFRQFSVVQA